MFKTIILLGIFFVAGIYYGTNADFKDWVDDSAHAAKEWSIDTFKELKSELKDKADDAVDKMDKKVENVKDKTDELNK